MKIHVGGRRGSVPVSGKETVQYGGDTLSLLVEGSRGGQLILDAGTGLRNLVPLIRPRAALLLTHFHLDHLLGLPYLETCWPDKIISGRQNFREILSRIFSPPIWPVILKDFEAIQGGAAMNIMEFTVTFHPVCHPNGCWAICVEEPSENEKMVLATDLEWGKMTHEEQGAFIDFAKDVQNLYFDAHFLPEEIEAYRGWGHSTWQEAMAVAKACNARTLHPVHFAPIRTDSEIHAIVSSIGRLLNKDAP